MDQKSFLIMRPDESGYEVCNRYLTVTAAPKDGFFTRINPAYWSRHKLLLLKIESMIKEGFEDHRNQRLRRMAQLPEGSRYSLQRRLGAERTTNVTRTEAVINQIRGYRIDTLERMVRAGKQELARLARTGGIDSESWVRERLSYGDVLQGGGSLVVNAMEYALNDVRQSLPQFAHEDLSELTGKDREDAEVLMKLSDTLRRSAMQETRRWEDECNYEVLRCTRYVSSDLARIALLHHEITERISDYLVDHPLPVTAAQVGHLREWIETPAHALTAGVL